MDWVQLAIVVGNVKIKIPQIQTQNTDDIQVTNRRSWSGIATRILTIDAALGAVRS
jgi:hypothetical protein